MSNGYQCITYVMGVHLCNVVHLSSLTWHLLSMESGFSFLIFLLLHVSSNWWGTGIVEVWSPCPAGFPNWLCRSKTFQNAPSFHKGSQPREKGPGSALFPGVQCRERWWWWVPASDALSSFPSSVQTEFPGWELTCSHWILVWLSRNQSLPGKNCRHKLYACIFILRLGVFAWYF